MAIVYSYPTTPASDLSGSDLLVLSKMDENGRPTKSVTLTSLVTYIDNNTGGGGGPFLPLSAGETKPLTGDLYMAPNGAGPSTGSKNLVFRGVDDNGTELDGGRIFTVDSTINPSGQDLYFQNANDNGVLATNLMIDAFGSVGIGTTSPNFTLDVTDGTGSFNNLTLGYTGPNYLSSPNALIIRQDIPQVSARGSAKIIFKGNAQNVDNVDAGAIFTSYDSTTAPAGGQRLNFQAVSFTNNLTQVMSLYGGNGSLRLESYGSGNITGTPTFNLEVDANGNVIETASGGGGGSGSGFASTIDFLSPGYQVTLYMENITPGSPDFGQAFAQPQGIYFRRQSAAATTQGGMPWNVYYNQYSPSLDPGYDAGFGCGSQTMCALVMLEESTADVNLLNSGGTVMGSQFTTNSQDLSALNSLRLPLAMRIDNGGASPGNGTIRLTLIEGTNNAPNPVDDAVCLPSTVSVYFRDTTLTSSKMGRPPFNLLWAGKDTRFAQYQNAGVAYTGSLDYVFTGNGAGTITRKYELFFQDEINSNSRCSYLKVTDGRVIFQDLPTVDPVSKGVVWNDAGTLKISLG